MSTFEDKVTAVYDFLANRASLGRLTNHQEVGTVAGVLLKSRQQRRIDSPVSRDKIRDVLVAVDQRSFEEKGVLLSSLVAHFWDNDSSRRFLERAEDRSINIGSTEGLDEYRRVVGTAFPEFYPVEGQPSRDDELDDDFFCPACGEEITEDVNEYVGRHRETVRV